jgi:DNA-binding MarR family transcriptional regulator
MVYNVQEMNNLADKEEALTLEILEVIENQSHVTQRHLADRLGVALGLANSYLKRCIRKGLIKVQQAPANRYFYYITPKGFAEKSRLTARFLSASFDFYRRAGNSLNDMYRLCRENGWERILFCGISELAEIASVRAVEHNIHIAGVFDPKAEQKRFLRLPVFRSLGDVGAFDACLLTAIDGADHMYRILAGQVELDRILIPAMLGLNSNNGVSRATRQVQ